MIVTFAGKAISVRAKSIAVGIDDFVIRFYREGGASVAFLNGDVLDDAATEAALLRRAFRLVRKAGLVRPAVKGECGVCRLV